MVGVRGLGLRGAGHLHFFCKVLLGFRVSRFGFNASSGVCIYVRLCVLGGSFRCRFV